MVLDKVTFCQCVTFQCLCTYIMTSELKKVFLWNLISGNLTNICWLIPVLVKSHTVRMDTMKTAYVCFCAKSVCNLQSIYYRQKCFKQNLQIKITYIWCPVCIFSTSCSLWVQTGRDSVLLPNSSTESTDTVAKRMCITVTPSVHFLTCLIFQFNTKILTLLLH